MLRSVARNLPQRLKPLISGSDRRPKGLLHPVVLWRRAEAHASGARTRIVFDGSPSGVERSDKSKGEPDHAASPLHQEPDTAWIGDYRWRFRAPATKQ